MSTVPTLADFGLDEKELLAEMARDTMAKLIAAEKTIERLRAALKPFADCVHDDNGEVTVTYGLCVPHDYFRAYCILRGDSRGQ